MMLFLREHIRELRNRPNLSKILVNISWLVFDKGIRLGVGLIVSLWVARYLGPTNYGLLNYALAIVALFAILVNLGLQNIILVHKYS